MQKIIYWLGMAVTLLFVGWGIMRFDILEVGKILQKVNYIWILSAALISTILIYLRSVRWVYFLAPLKAVSIRDSFMATSIGFLANMVLPARLGEFVRVWVIGRKVGISKSAVFGTAVIERTIDGLSLVVLILLVILLVEPPDEHLVYWEAFKTTGYTISIFYLSVFTVLYLFQKRVRWVEWLLDFSITVLPEHFGIKVKSAFEAFRSGFGFMESGRHVIAIFVWTLIFWAVAAGINISYFYAFRLYELPIIATYFVLVAQILGSMLPSAPGFVGTYHAAAMASLMLYGVGQELALSMAILMHAVLFVTNILPGIVFLWLEKISFVDLKHSSEDGES